MVLVVVGFGLFRRDHYNTKANKVNHHLYLDMIEETRAYSKARLISYYQRTGMHYKGQTKVLPLRVETHYFVESCQIPRYKLMVSLVLTGKDPRMLNLYYGKDNITYLT